MGHLRSRSRTTFLASAGLFWAVVAFRTGAPSPAAAAPSFVRPWTPPAADSLTAWAAEALARFRANQGDSVGGSNYRAYQIVGTIGRGVLRSLGRRNAVQAHVLQPLLDSLGLKTEVAIDPQLPEFVLMVVHNPFRPTADALGFLYWYRVDDLRIQGVVLNGGRDPLVRVWWTGRSESPYEWGIVYHQASPEGEMKLLLIRLDQSGSFWSEALPEREPPDLGGAGRAAWVDVNGDELPELITWVRAQPDSTFEECGECPHLLTERTFTERREGFTLNDSRLVPTPYANFVLFVRLLREGNRAAASRLLVNPAKLDQALALGWGGRATRDTWRVEYAEDEHWPHWLALRFNGSKGPQHYIVHFATREGRWIIQDWLVPTKAPGTPAGRARSK